MSVSTCKIVLINRYKGGYISETMYRDLEDIILQDLHRNIPPQEK